MKMAKASEADLNMAMELTSALDVLGQRFLPAMPEAIEKLGEDDEREPFDRHDDEQCGRALRHLLDLADRASLSRVVFGCAVMLDPANKCVDPDADTIEHHPDVIAGLRALHGGAKDVLAERQRQINAEGWTPEHDDEHADGDLALAAACYALPEIHREVFPRKDPRNVGRSAGESIIVYDDVLCPILWPWHGDGWKPKDRRTDLVKAGALILAEIERIDRAAEKGGAA